MEVKQKQINFQFTYLKNKLKQSNIEVSLDNNNNILTFKDKPVKTNKTANAILLVFSILLILLVFLKRLNFSFLIVPFGYVAWKIYSLFFYPKIHENQLLEIDLINKELSHSSGLAYNVQTLSNLKNQNFIFELFRGSLHGQSRIYSVTLYWIPKNGERVSLLRHNGPFESDCFEFTKALNQFFSKTMNLEEFEVIKTY